MAFGDSTFGEPKTNTRGRGMNRNRGGSGGGGGGGNRNRNNRNRNNNNNGGGSGIGAGLAPDPFSPADVGPGNPFDSSPPVFGGGPFGTQGTPIGSVGNPPPATLPGGAQPGGLGSIFTDETAQDASGDLDAYRATTWGLLNQAGISQNPIFGQAASDWLDDSEIDDWYSQWEGLAQVAGEDRPDYSEFLTGLFGVKPPPGDAPGLDWYRDELGPAAQRYISSRFESLPQSQRGARSRNYGGPRRVVAF